LIRVSFFGWKVKSIFLWTCFEISFPFIITFTITLKEWYHQLPWLAKPSIYKFFIYFFLYICYFTLSVYSTLNIEFRTNHAYCFMWEYLINLKQEKQYFACLNIIFLSKILFFRHQCWVFSVG
jgi:hypothetical protein